MLMHLLSGIVLVGSSVYFIAVAVLVFVKPESAQRFFLGFASSARTHIIEQILRVIVGGSLVIYSPSMWQPGIFFLIGWAIVVSSVMLMLFPWQWHQRFAERILPVFLRHMKWYAIGTFLFGSAILYAVFFPQLG